MKKFLISLNVVIAFVSSIMLLLTLIAFIGNRSDLVIVNINNYVGNGFIIVSSVVILSFQLLFLNIKYLNSNPDSISKK